MAGEQSKQNHTLTHIAGTFVIEASASFLNGAGLGEGEDRNVSVVKTFRDGKYRVPYVSAQAWRRWLRNTLIEETGWPPSIIKALNIDPKKLTTKKIGGEFNPVDFAEDDIFGYMRTERGSGRPRESSESEPSTETANTTDTVDNESNSGDINEPSKHVGEKVKSVARTSPLSTSILISLRKEGWRGKDDGYVHLKEGFPVPYTTEFYRSNLQGIFCLNYRRLGVFSNIGDRIELDKKKEQEFLKNSKIREIQMDDGSSGKVYEMTDAEATRKVRTSELLKALSRLRGGSKQAAFGTDVSPKAFIVAGLTCGNPIFNSNLFADDGDGVILKVEALKEIIKDYSDRIATSVYIGIRKGYLKNENEVVKELTHNAMDLNGINFIVTTPIDAAEQMSKSLTTIKNG